MGHVAQRDPARALRVHGLTTDAVRHEHGAAHPRGRVDGGLLRLAARPRGERAAHAAARRDPPGRAGGRLPQPPPGQLLLPAVHHRLAGAAHGAAVPALVRRLRGRAVPPRRVSVDTGLVPLRRVAVQEAHHGEYLPARVHANHRVLPALHPRVHAPPPRARGRNAVRGESALGHRPRHQLPAPLGEPVQRVRAAGAHVLPLHRAAGTGRDRGTIPLLRHVPHVHAAAAGVVPGRRADHRVPGAVKGGDVRGPVPVRADVPAVPDVVAHKVLSGVVGVRVPDVGGHVRRGVAAARVQQRVLPRACVRALRRGQLRGRRRGVRDGVGGGYGETPAQCDEGEGVQGDVGEERRVWRGCVGKYV